MSDPRHLKDEPQIPAALRHDLERVQGLAPRAYDVHAGLSRLHMGIAATASTAAIKTAIWPWVTAAGLASVTLLGAVAMRSTQVNAPIAAAHVAPAPVTPVVADALPAAQMKEPASRIEAPHSVAPATIDRDTLLRQETAHLARAREALQESSSDALRLAQQGERRFAGGMFGQERQAIIVLSSLRLGHSSAPAAARAFLDSYPHSPLADRIRDELSSNQRSP